MNNINFEDLHINQTVWYKGEKTFISGLNITLDDLKMIRICASTFIPFSNVVNDLSLTPPKTKNKRKFYLWICKYKDPAKKDNYTICDSLFTTDLIESRGEESPVKDLYDWIKIPGTEVEIEVDW